jgi:sulfate transport system substrate-binding protein
MKQTFKTAAVAGSVASLMALAACGGASSGSEGSGGDGGGSGSELNLVGFSVLEAANKEIISGFQATDEGKGTSFLPSYGASGDQSRAVEAGKKADIVHFSLEPDLQRLVDAGLVAEDWNAGPTKGILSQSVVVFVTRPGNPKGIESWEDLVKDDVEVITPNPASSGSAKWNILAGYGHTLADGGTEADAEKYLTSMLEHTVALPESGRDATTLFDSGTGDVLLSYENEAILAKQNGADIDYVLPDTTLLIENPGAVTTDAAPEAQGYLDYVLSEAGQEVYAKYGFRPLADVDVEVEGANDPADAFPEPETLLTVSEDFGGWAEANSKYFDEEKGIVTLIQQETGKE